MLNFRLKIRDFFKRNKSKILIALLVWLVIFIINQIVKNYKGPQIPTISYSPHEAIMDNSKVPEKIRGPIEELIGKYIDCCNNKDYEGAYNLLSEECKRELYPNIEDFKKYIDTIFNEKKVHAIQDFSNKDNTYVYKVDIFEDILKTGMTGEDELSVYSEKFVIKNDNNNLSLSIREYIEKRENYQIYEDEYIKVEVLNMTQTYENQVYSVKLTNRSQYPIVLANKTEKYEILLELKDDRRNIQDMPNGGIYLNPYESKQTEFKFVKFFDENQDVKSIVFNAVRVFKSYSGLESKRQSEMDNAIKLYSFRVGL